MIKRALISVYDKTGLVKLAGYLQDKGVEIISSGGTYQALSDAGIKAIKVSDVTGAEEILEGRVKTLHPAIHAGILARADQLIELKSRNIKSIDLVIVNLYPFEQVAALGAGLDEALENIDIGGPAMLRAAAKNHPRITVICDPADYESLIEQLQANNGDTSDNYRASMAAKVFARTSAYDKAIAGYLARHLRKSEDEFPDVVDFSFARKSTLRYGENPHQKAALYIESGFAFTSLAEARVLSGKELSFNNLWDLEAALQMILDFAEPFAAVIKHTNPCGAAIGDTPADAYHKALASDPLSAFGSIIGLNRPVDMDTARLLDETHFIECIIAPDFEPEALALMKKKKARRLVATGTLIKPSENYLELRRILGGALLQTRDIIEINANDLKTVTKVAPSPEQVSDLLFGFKLVKHVKSNAVLICRDKATVGVGMGQTSRVDASMIAVRKAGNRAKGAVAAGDAFFPMPDGLEVLINAGVQAVIQPGGSKGDPEVIAAADKAGIAMVFTGVRHFKH